MLRIGYRDHANAARLAARHLQLRDAPHLIRVANAAVYQCGPYALRVTLDANHTLPRLHRLLAQGGLAVPTVFGTLPFGGLHVTVLEWIDADPSAEPDWFGTGQQVRALHYLTPGDLGDITAPHWFNSRLDKARTRLRSVRGARLPERAAVVIESHLKQVAAAQAREQSRPFSVLHADLHSGNLLQSRAGPRVLDLDSVSIGPALWDHGALLLEERHFAAPRAPYESFASGYGANYRDHPSLEPAIVLGALACTLWVHTLAPTEQVLAQQRVRTAYWANGDTTPWAGIGCPPGPTSPPAGQTDSQLGAPAGGLPPQRAGR